MKTTEWYCGNQKPVRVGVYQRLYRKEQLLFSYWDGWNWSIGCYTVNDAVVFGMLLSRELVGAPARDVNDAVVFGMLLSHSQNLPWRGVEK